MAKKVKKHNKNASATALPENMLPQNIRLMGERVEENKNIYISQAVYKEIHKFTKNKTINESGGMLVGTVIEEFGKTNIIISGFVVAKFCEATPTTLKFTHETWDFVHKEIEKKHKDKKIVGWIHTHPNFGIFLSEYDKFIHQNFFNEAYQTAYVVDPIQNIEGFYFWINGSLERCKGFYIYDKTGTRITIEADKEAAETVVSPKSAGGFQNVLIAILFVAMAFLIFFNITLSSRYREIERQVQTLEMQQIALADSANQVLYQMQQMIAEQSEEIQVLKNTLAAVGITDQTENQTTSEDNTSTEPDEGVAEDPTQDETAGGENTNE